MTDSLLYALAAVICWGASLYIAYREGRVAGFIRARDVLFDSKLERVTRPWTV